MQWILGTFPTTVDPVRRGASRVQPQRLVGARYRLLVPVEFLQRLSFGLICRGVPWIRFRCPVRHVVAPRRLLGSCGSAPLPRRAGAPLPGCQGDMRARRDLPSPYHGAGRGPAALSPSNRRHPVHLAPFACSKLQAMDVYPFEGQGLPTPTAGMVAKKATRPALPPDGPAVPSPRAAKDAAVSGPSRDGFIQSTEIRARHLLRAPAGDGTATVTGLHPAGTYPQKT